MAEQLKVDEVQKGRHISMVRILGLGLGFGSG